MNTSRQQQFISNHGRLPVVFAGITLVFGALYLYATNAVAVQGYAVRSAEKEIAQLRQDTNQLRIEEAELRSLYRIEEAGKRFGMFEPAQMSVLAEAAPIALR
jgi:hypothetical protein